jgi:hypothetical protein
MDITGRRISHAESSGRPRYRMKNLLIRQPDFGFPLRNLHIPSSKQLPMSNDQNEARANERFEISRLEFPWDLGFGISKQAAEDARPFLEYSPTLKYLSQA